MRRGEQSIPQVARELGIAESCLRNWSARTSSIAVSVTSRAPSHRQLGDAWLLEQIREIWSANREAIVQDLDVLPLDDRP